MDPMICNEIVELFDIKVKSLSLGFKYLGFMLKPNNYKVEE